VHQHGPFGWQAAAVEEITAGQVSTAQARYSEPWVPDRVYQVWSPGLRKEDWFERPSATRWCRWGGLLLGRRRDGWWAGPLCPAGHLPRQRRV